MEEPDLRLLYCVNQTYRVAGFPSDGARCRKHGGSRPHERAAGLGSCHTAVVGRYVIEGHVPAADVLRMLKETPEAVGLVVPGMPLGSPGMDGPDYANCRHPYRVLLLAKDGSTRVFSTYR